MPYDYERNPAEIYRASFATVQGEANLQRFSAPLATVVTRMIHACGHVPLADEVQASADFVASARAALGAGKPIFCDCQMVMQGVIARQLPAHNPLICSLNDPQTAPLAQEIGNTRSAAAVQAWLPQLDGALVLIGNAPTALFALLEALEAGAPRPAAIIGIPVGFVGAAESKRALSEQDDVPFITVHGRLGGSAIAASVINALTVA